VNIRTQELSASWGRLKSGLDQVVLDCGGVELIAIESVRIK